MNSNCPFDDHSFERRTLEILKQLFVEQILKNFRITKFGLDEMRGSGFHKRKEPFELNSFFM